MPISNPRAELKYTILDYTGKASTMTFPIDPTSDGAGLVSDLSDALIFRSKLVAITGGTVIRQEAVSRAEVFQTILPTNPNVQRERRWIAVYEDTVNFNRGQLTIPTARVSDPTNEAIVDGNGFAILTMPQWVEFVSQFQAHARSISGNTVRVLYAYIQDDNL